MKKNQNLKLPSFLRKQESRVKAAASKHWIPHQVRYDDGEVVLDFKKIRNADAMLTPLIAKERK